MKKNIKSLKSVVAKAKAKISKTVKVATITPPKQLVVLVDGQTDLTAHAANVLNSMTEAELSQVCDSLAIGTGSTKAETIVSITNAIRSGVAVFKTVNYISLPPDANDCYGRNIFGKKIRTHKVDKQLHNLSNCLV
jgi:hypothetical protein